MNIILFCITSIATALVQLSFIKDYLQVQNLPSLSSTCKVKLAMVKNSSYNESIDTDEFFSDFDTF